MWRKLHHTMRVRQAGPGVRASWREAKLALMALILLAFAAGCQKSRTLTDARGKQPSQVVEQYIDLIKRGEARKAYALRTAEIRQNLDYRAFERFVQQRDQGEASGWEVVITIKPVRQRWLSSDRAEVEVQYQRDGHTRTMTITCDKEGGVWKLGSFS